MDNELIAKIADEITCILGTPAKEESADTLVVVCDYVTRAGDASAHLWERFGGRVKIAALQEYGQPGFTVARLGEQEMLKAASESDAIIFLSPRIAMLYNMAQGMDGECLESLFCRCLLMGKKVHIMLDYSPPSRFKKGSVFQRVSESLDALAAMGVSTLPYTGGHAGEEGLSLVTENDVTAAYKQNNTRVVCRRGAIVTPAAWDRAKELNMQIERQGK